MGSIGPLQKGIFNFSRYVNSKKKSVRTHKCV